MTEQLTLSAVDTVLGPMLIATTRRGVLAVRRVTDPSTMEADLRRRLPDAVSVRGTNRHVEWLAGWARGERRDLPPVDLRGVAPFDVAVYRAVRDLAWGDTATYGEVALAIGHPGAARAVGGAMGRCPLFPAVPCHRVVRAADGWSGWGGDDGIKRRLLDREAR